MIANYITASLPEPVILLGRKLRPFCLGHFKILTRFECSFVADGEVTASREDLIFAVLVCSMRPKEFLEFIEQDDAIEQVKAWGEKIGGFDFAEKAAEFQKYLAANSQMPRFWIEQESNKPSGAHWSQCVKHALTQVGYTAEEADELPLAQAFWEYLKKAETEGAIRLFTDDENKEVEEAQHGTPA